MIRRFLSFVAFVIFLFFGAAVTDLIISFSIWLPLKVLDTGISYKLINKWLYLPILIFLWGFFLFIKIGKKRTPNPYRRVDKVI